MYVKLGRGGDLSSRLLKINVYKYKRYKLNVLFSFLLRRGGGLRDLKTNF